MPRIRSKLDLNKVPHPSTLCRAFNKLSMKKWRNLLRLSVKKLDISGVAGIDASGFDRSHASRYYTQRSEMKLSSLKTTLLVDANGAIVDLHVTTTRKI
ncbi:MAG: Transposase IS5 family [Candidatus Methanohalarchaeum thermophilum]|uniref:Transposase IS5 family n=1 Tax=Methanohalarchaeum thermophilum TaxID=1903181 RepID=A0A1Q6DVZ1_METT1|nr:MAG: Transposase IS5 family [Candidatus Methanohalarchaeum thermophilum]